MEKIFRALPCTEEQKVSFATFTFKEDAQEWWLVTLEKEEIVTWARFLEVFYEKYFPESLPEQKASEFLHLRQGTMSVAEYESKFTRLARFAPYVIPTEARKTRKFEAGLDAEIKDRLEVLKLPTYAEVVDRTYIAEKGIKTTRSSEMGQKRRFWEPVGGSKAAPPKKVNFGSTSSTGSANQGFTIPKGSTIPNCRSCGKAHRGQCFRSETRNRHRREEGTGMPRAFALVPRNSNATENVVTGTLSVCGHLARVLFDSGSTHSFVAPHFVSKLTSTPEPLGYALSVAFPFGVTALSTKVYKSCVISLKDETLYVDLIPLCISSFDIILGIYWLAANHASIDCTTKKIFLRLPDQRELVFEGTGVSTPPYMISSVIAHQILRKGCGGCIFYVVDAQQINPTLDSIPVVREFPNVFPEDLPGTLVDREIEFTIDTQPNAQPISKTPYRMSLTELKELKTQL
ncbi:uncharacterized protein LOC114261264 [Camellia sinensis]|uniref:uncharacterized protein LOC114261264 n=1 Tax=Camellia sinensis TaxID=4442 RepID=UPI00103696F3|nr:uncharacterized protein LOC114261264 [Camellia sinensis]